MNGWDILILVVIAAAVAAAVIVLKRKPRKGGCGCCDRTGSCASCPDREKRGGL